MTRGMNDPGLSEENRGWQPSSRTQVRTGDMRRHGHDSRQDRPPILTTRITLVRTAPKPSTRTTLFRAELQASRSVAQHDQAAFTEGFMDEAPAKGRQAHAPAGGGGHRLEGGVSWSATYLRTEPPGC